MCTTGIIFTLHIITRSDWNTKHIIKLSSHGISETHESIPKVILYKQVANPKDRFQKSGSTDTDKNSTYLPAQSEPECYTAPAAVNVTDNSYSTALIHHHTTAAAV